MGCQNSQNATVVPYDPLVLQEPPHPMTSIQNLMDASKCPLNGKKTKKAMITQGNKENNVRLKPLVKCDKETEALNETQLKQGYLGKNKSKSQVKKTAKFEIFVLPPGQQKKQENVCPKEEGQKSKSCSLKLLEEKDEKQIQNIGPSTVSIGQIQDKSQAKLIQNDKQQAFKDFQIIAPQNLLKENCPSSKTSNTSETFKFEIFAQSGQVISQTQKVIKLQLLNQQKQQVDRYLKDLFEAQTLQIMSKIITHLQQRQMIWKCSNKDQQDS